LRRARGVLVRRERDREDVAGGRGGLDAAVVREACDEPELGRVGRHVRETVLLEAADAALRGERLRVANAAACRDERNREQDDEGAGHGSDCSRAARRHGGRIAPCSPGPESWSAASTSTSS